MQVCDKILKAQSWAPYPGWDSLTDAQSYSKNAATTTKVQSSHLDPLDTQSTQNRPDDFRNNFFN